jgi:hypothetical protein
MCTAIRSPRCRILIKSVSYEKCSHEGYLSSGNEWRATNHHCDGRRGGSSRITKAVHSFSEESEVTCGMSQPLLSEIYKPKLDATVRHNRFCKTHF